MVGGPICLVQDCPHYLSHRACGECLKMDLDVSCSICGDKPSIPVYHNSPDPFYPIRKTTCKSCEQEDIWVTREGICSTCNKLPVTRSFKVQHFCGTHASMVRHYCKNGHTLTGPYVPGTLLCKKCSVSTNAFCMGCSRELRLTSVNPRSAFCTNCAGKIERSVCTSCNKSTVKGTVDERGFCDDCAENYK